jgi:hypothetical protein
MKVYTVISNLLFAQMYILPQKGENGIAPPISLLEPKDITFVLFAILLIPILYVLLKKRKKLILSLSSVDRETKVISVILFITALSLVGAYYLDRQYFVDWSDVEKIAEYDSEVIIGDTIQISYYLVNPKSHEVKVEPRLSHGLSTYYESNPEERITTNVNVHPLYKIITVPAKSKLQVFAETVTATQLGTLHVEVTGLPEVRIDVLPEYSYVMKLNSEPHLAKGRIYYTIDITMLNDGMSDINVKLENVRICDITHANMTVDVRGYDIIPDYAGYFLVPANGTQSIRYVTGEVVHDSIFYVRIEFTLHIYELDKMEIISTWLHRKSITS